MISSTLTAAVTCHQALAHPVRLRVLAALRDGRLCVGELQELSGLAFSTVSRHVSELECAGLVEQIKEGRWVWCQLARGETARRTLQCIWAQLASDPTLAADRSRAQRLRAGRQGAGCRATVGPCREEEPSAVQNAVPGSEEVG